jgi:hypothetical protein
MAVAIPQQLKLIIAVVGIFGSFSYFAVLQEDLFKKSYAVRDELVLLHMAALERRDLTRNPRLIWLPASCRAASSLLPSS